MQALSRELAFDPAGWTAERLDRINQLFDGLAPEWHTRGNAERLRPLQDAQERGGIPTGGTCLEIGSGIGLHTPALLRHFDSVVSIDLSAEMLALSPRPAATSLLRADASRLPIASGSVGAVALVNMFLFPSELDRVLRAGGRLVFVSTSGLETPIYLPPADVVRALEPAFGSVDAITSRAGWGTWTVVTKAGS
jgi:SAM-dependent methyltransferase